jgi:hypothetical protein
VVEDVQIGRRLFWRRGLHSPLRLARLVVACAAPGAGIGQLQRVFKMTLLNLGLRPPAPWPIYCRPVEKRLLSFVSSAQKRKGLRIFRRTHLRLSSSAVQRVKPGGGGLGTCCVQVEYSTVWRSATWCFASSFNAISLPAPCLYTCTLHAPGF